MSRSQQPTLKWQPPVKLLVLDYLKKHKRVKRATLYKTLNNHSDRVVRFAVTELVREGKIIEDPCECGFTAFLELA